METNGHQYWWVSQNQTFESERRGGYLWAPKQNESGQSFYHWRNMTRISRGDLIFSYCRQKIVAVSEAQTQAFESTQPEELESTNRWLPQGWRVDVEYHDVQPALVLSDRFRAELRYLQPSKYGALDKRGQGVVGYLFEVPPKMAEAIIDRLVDRVDPNVLSNREDRGR